MIDLVAFLRARLDEDEVAAQAAADGDSGTWFVGGKWNVYRAEDEARFDEDYQGDEHRLVVYGNMEVQSEHIGRHDPARVLREAEADRALIAALQRAQRDQPAPESFHDDPYDPAVSYGAGEVAGLLLAAKLRAAVYRDHPDYDQEWAPG